MQQLLSWGIEKDRHQCPDREGSLNFGTWRGNYLYIGEVRVTSILSIPAVSWAIWYQNNTIPNKEWDHNGFGTWAG